MVYRILPLILLIISTAGYTSHAQHDNVTTTPTTAALSKETQQLYPRSGRFFAFWGYNRSAYSHSNIHFRGDGYDFRISDIRATDNPKNFSWEYAKLDAITVPQFNLRVGYYLDDKTFVSLGYDHMKYGMVKQSTRLTGYIRKGGVNEGTYNNTEVVVGEDCEVNNPGPSYIDGLPGGFVSNFEHCDGLNDVTAEIGRLNQLWISKDHKHALAVTGSAGLGMVVPDSDVDLLGQEPKHDMEKNKKAYHLAGYSVSATMGFEFDVFTHIFILARLKAGYINLPDINTTAQGGKASQHFTFIEPMAVVGYSFHL